MLYVFLLYEHTEPCVDKSWNLLSGMMIDRVVKYMCNICFTVQGTPFLCERECQQGASQGGSRGPAEERQLQAAVWWGGGWREKHIHATHTGRRRSKGCPYILEFSMLT